MEMRHTESFSLIGPQIGFIGLHICNGMFPKQTKNYNTYQLSFSMKYNPPRTLNIRDCIFHIDWKSSFLTSDCLALKRRLRLERDYKIAAQWKKN